MKKNYNNSRRFTKHKNTNANQTQADIQSINFKIRKKLLIPNSIEPEFWNLFDVVVAPK